MNALSIRKPVWTGQTANLLLSCLFFIPPILNVITYRYLRLPYEITAWILYGWIVGMVLGVVIGWYVGFPRWFYPYALTILGLMIAISIGSDSDMTWQENLYFKMLVLIPAILFFVLVWFFFRKKHPLTPVFTNIRKDWTLISFAIYGLLAVVVNGIFTNIRSVYGAPFLLIATITMIAGAVAYILLGDHFQRYYVLAAAMTVTWIIAGVGSATFWHGKQAAWMQQPANGYELSLQYVIFWSIMLALMLLPLLVIVIRRATAKV